MSAMRGRKRFALLTFLLVLCYGVSVSFASGAFNSHCDYKLSSGTHLRVVRNGPYQAGWIDPHWACDLRIVMMNLAGGLPMTLAESKGNGGGECEGKCKEFQQVGQQILVGNEFYSSDGGRIFVEPIQLTNKLPGSKVYMDQRFSLSGNTLVVQAWHSYEYIHTEPADLFTSSDGGKNWKRTPQFINQ
jgi:hypothetical protein